jgi:hypothetical protein
MIITAKARLVDVTKLVRRICRLNHDLIPILDCTFVGPDSRSNGGELISPKNIPKPSSCRINVEGCPKDINYLVCLA